MISELWNLALLWERGQLKRAFFPLIVSRVMCCGECHESDGLVIDILEVGGWETNDFGSSVCNKGHLVVVGMMRK